MSRVIAFLGLLCLVPYAYVGWYWLDWWLLADTNELDAHMLFYSFVLLAAAPFLLAFFAICSAVSSARTVKAGLTQKKPMQVAKGSSFLWVSVVVAITMTAFSWQLYGILFPEIEEGRDRLGRICESDGSSTTCRPDPERQRSTIDMLNAQRRSQ